MILMTGGSGQLASLIAARMKREGYDFLTASRGPDADRQMDFDRVETLEFAGVETLFLTSAGYAEDDVVMRRHGAVIHAARTQGVRHIVYTSLSRASDHLGFALAHRWTERQLKESGLRWTILRNGLYAELIGALAAPQDGRITAPFGTGPISAAAREDLADAAAVVLGDPAAHAGSCYELSGRTAFAVPQIAERLGLPYRPLTLEAERRRLADLPLLPFQPAMMMSIYAAASAGFLETDATDLLHLVPAPHDALAVACAAATGKTA